MDVILYILNFINDLEARKKKSQILKILSFISIFKIRIYTINVVIKFNENSVSESLFIICI